MEIFQVYRQHPRIEKNFYSPETRRSLFKECEIIESHTGFVENNILHLPQPSNQFPNIEKASIVIIQDIENYDPRTIERNLRDSDSPEWLTQNWKNAIAKNNLQLIYYIQPNQRYYFEIFSIFTGEHSSFEFYLEYDRNNYRIGVPKRTNHKIFELPSNESFGYRLNGKIDGYGQRTFNEFRYYIKHLGSVKEIKYDALNRVKRIKEFNFRDIKVIDETKILF